MLGAATIKVMYVGHSKSVITRILNHCGRTNVEGSALRQSVAVSMGYKLLRTERPGGTSVKIRIKSLNPSTGETQVSKYIRSGKWRYIICESEKAARDFKGYVIEQLKPLLNKASPPWNPAQNQQYQKLLIQLQGSPLRSYGQFRGQKSGPGVLILYHQKSPPLSKYEAEN